MIVVSRVLYEDVPGDVPFAACLRFTSQLYTRAMSTAVVKDSRHHYTTGECLRYRVLKGHMLSPQNSNN